MKKIIFLANDPGGYDVIRPVYDLFLNEGSFDVRLYLSGAAGKTEPDYCRSREEIMRLLPAMKEAWDDFLLVTGTSWNSDTEIQAVRWCKDHHIKTAAVLDYWSNYKERFRSGSAYIFPDHYFVMDDLAFQEAVRSGVDASIMTVVGHPGLDAYINKRAVLRDHRQNKILFLSQPLSALYGDSRGYTESDALEDIIKAGRESGYRVRVKFHPKETEKMRSLYSDISVDGVLEEAVKDYDIVAGMNTMGLLYCSLMGIPVISYEPHLKGPECSIVHKLGITKAAHTYEELMERLKDTGNFRDHKYPFWYDGKSAKRCAAEILKICNEF